MKDKIMRLVDRMRKALAAGVTAGTGAASMAVLGGHDPEAAFLAAAVFAVGGAAVTYLTGNKLGQAELRTLLDDAMSKGRP